LKNENKNKNQEGRNILEGIKFIRGIIYAKLYKHLGKSEKNKRRI